ncbi:MAG: endopeptidase La, partial [Synergistes sp.]|nr:endopeptidase La [Synergistes sp.]
DPSSALLEVLDTEQNYRFTDNFLEVPFDLSKVMFITTANNASAIPRPLLDRMELITLPGYVMEEKVEIAKRHLIPRIVDENGIAKKDLKINDEGLRYIISSYTMEAGVRSLDRALTKAARKIAAEIEKNGEPKRSVSLSKKRIHELLDAPKIHGTQVPKESSVGKAIGLAWTENGGDVLIIESVLMPGTGRILTTGNLGNIMKESTEAAVAYIKSHSEELGLSDFEWDKKDVHIHVPAGAVPKDGPSAGITLALSLCSSLTGRKIDAAYAMTGEITLHGDVLPIGGLREKILAAKRHGITDIILPEANRNDTEGFNDWILGGMTLHFVENVSEVFALALKADKK